MAALSEDSYLSMALDAAQANSAWQAQQAEINRQWETEMSNTAHQREVADLAAAGLNPIISANSGARWSSVGNATADTNNSSALANMASTVMNTRAMVQAASISAGAQVAAASISAAAQRYASDMSYQNSLLNNAKEIATPNLHTLLGQNILDITTSARKGYSRDNALSLGESANQYLWNLYGGAASKYRF